MDNSVGRPGPVSPHSASAQPESASRVPSADSASGRRLDAYEVSHNIGECQNMTAGQLQALIDAPDRTITGFNFEGNKALTVIQFGQFTARSTPLFPLLKFSQVNIVDTNLGAELIAASDKWPLMEQLFPIFMPKDAMGLCLGYPTEIVVRDAEAFLQALKTHPDEAKLIEVLDLEGADLTNEEFAEIVGYLENVTDLDVPDTVTEMPDLKHLVHLKHINGDAVERG